MDSRINNIKRLIELKKKNCPNITNFWLKYLEEKISFLNESLDKAEEIFTDTEDNIKQDISYSTITVLYLINQERLP